MEGDRRVQWNENEDHTGHISRRMRVRCLTLSACLGVDDLVVHTPQNCTLQSNCSFHRSACSRIILDIRVKYAVTCKVGTREATDQEEDKEEENEEPYDHFDARHVERFYSAHRSATAIFIRKPLLP